MKETLRIGRQGAAGTRRHFLGMSAGLAAASAWPGEAFAQYQGQVTAATPTVPTSNGPVIGYVEDGVSTFRGLRYGAPPVGPLRFMPPTKPAPWSKPMLAVYDGRPEYQVDTFAGMERDFPELSTALFQDVTSTEDYIRRSEDCLSFNLWSAGLDNRKRPVMVWLHGGGFTFGSGNLLFYNGHNLAKRHDVVLITVNHRLNAFGFMNTAEIGGDPASGNAGMLDIVQVLEWVRDNIAEFGGDPDCVTVFGQSGGGGKVSALMAMPRAKGLFHRGIIESGPGLRGADKNAAAATTKAMMAKLGVSDLAGLQAVAPDALLAASLDKFRWGPIRDGVSMPDHPFDPVANPLSATVPILIGGTRDESVVFDIRSDGWNHLSEADMRARLTKTYGDKADALIAAARAMHPTDNPSYIAAAIASIGGFFAPSTVLAERKALTPGGAWMYAWEWVSPFDHGALRASHTMEIPFVFDNVEFGQIYLGRDPSTPKLAHLVSTVWTNFARTGDPNTKGLPAWPKYDGTSRPTMILDNKCRLENDPYAALRRLFAEMPARGVSG